MKKKFWLILLALASALCLAFAIAACGGGGSGGGDKGEHTHSFTWVYNDDATCTEDGTETEHCTCGETGDTRTKAGTKLGHDIQPLPAKEATCSESGHSAHNGCTRCGYTTDSNVTYSDALHVKYELNEKKTAYIVKSLDSSCTDQGIAIPKFYKGLPVTSIGAWAFDGCSGLTSITIPDSVTSIGYSAFEECSGLTGELKIPDSVTSIGGSAFYKCSGLTSVTIGSGATSIRNDAFDGCSGLEKLIVDEENTAYSSQDGILYNRGKTEIIKVPPAIKGAIVIPDSVTSIGDGAFSSCSGLTSITIPDSVTSIGDAAFLGCDGLTSITIPNSVTSIGYYAFYGCSGLTGELEIPASVASIGWYAFANSGLESLTIGSGVTSIGNYAFHECSGLTSVTIGSGVTSIGRSAFEDCRGLTSIEIPNGVTSIGEQAFAYCSGLTSVTIGSGVTSIGEGAFSGCYTLIEVWNHSALPIERGSETYGYVAAYAKHVYGQEKGIQTVTDEGYIFYEEGDEHYLLGYCGDQTELSLPEKSPTGYDYAIYQYAFYKCSGLKSVKLGSGVTSIGNYAFSGCSGLTNVTIGNGVTAIGAGAFV